MSGIDLETGEISYPYLDSEGRVICDPTPLAVPVGISQIAMSDTQIPHSLVENRFVDIDGDGDWDLMDEADVMPLTQYEIDALDLKPADSPAPPPVVKEEVDNKTPPLE